MKKSNSKTTLPASLRSSQAPHAPSMMKTSLALGISTALLLPLATIAAETESDQAPKETVLTPVKVKSTAIESNPNAEAGVPYKAKTSADTRHTRPLAETPQTITVITKAAIEDAGTTDLRQILDAQPGITLGTGENGNAFGDRYIIRGQEARSDVFVDGLRDPGMSIRESFALEQIEISKGPNSSFAGRGSAGGAINAVTKQATREYDFVKLSTGFGTDDHTRLTLDTNQRVGDDFAVRANLLYGKEDVPGRSPADRERQGIALSGLWAPTDALNIVLDYYRFKGKDNPDVGTYVNRTTRKVNKDMPVYLQDSDFLLSNVETYTGRVNYQFADDVKLTNLTRYGTTDNSYITTGAGPSTTGANNPGGAYPTITLDTGHTGWQQVEYFANQTNLLLTHDLAGLKNELILGLEYSNNTSTRGNYSLGVPTGAAGGRNCITGTGNALNAWCITGPTGSTVANVHGLQNRNIARNIWSNDWNVKTISGYAMDTIDLTDQFTLFGGLRYDRYRIQVSSPRGNAPYKIDESDHLLTAHLGLTYKINPMGMVYLSYADAEDINGGESDANGSGYGGLVVLDGEAAADPEKSKNVELGTKWNIFDDKLLLTAALFQTIKSDVMESLSGADYATTGTYNTGKNRVRGLELGVTGEITDNLTAQAGYTLMQSRVMDSQYPAYEGAPLANFAQNSSFVQLRYELTDALAFGGVMRYEGKRYVGQPDTAAVNAVTGAPNYATPSYTVYDLFASYRFNRDFDMRLNINNVTDKDYYLAGYRSGNFIYIGDARSVRLTLNYEFH